MPYVSGEFLSVEATGDEARSPAREECPSPAKEDAALLSEAEATMAPRRLWRLTRPAAAVLCLAGVVTLAAAGHTGHTRLIWGRRSWSGANDLQDKEFLARPQPTVRLAHTPDCTTGPLPALWQAASGPPVRLSVLSYNLFWWKLFDLGLKPSTHLRTPGNAATRLLAQHGHQENYDVMGFQECQDGNWLLAKAGLGGEYAIFQDKELGGATSVCMAYNKQNWALLGRGVEYVAEDPKWGLRPAQWMRLRNLQTGALVFFLNHHGPIPINTGGLCGPRAVGYNILQVINTHAVQGDAIVVTGDFNANPSSPTIQVLAQRLTKAFGGHVDGGIDYIWSNLPAGAVVSTANLGSGGSDHEAISAVLQRGTPPQAEDPVAMGAFRPPNGSPASEVLNALMQHNPVAWLKK